MFIWHLWMEVAMDSLYGKNTIKNLFGNEKLADLILDHHNVKIKPQVMNVPRKKIVIEENTVHEFFYFIKEGIFILKKGNQIVDLIGPTSVIGLYDLFVGEKASLSVISLTPAVLVKIGKEELLAKIFSIQEGAIFHINYMHSALNSLISHRNLLGLPLKKRLLKVMEKLAINFGSEDQEYYYLPKEMTTRIVANYCNCNVNTITKIFKEFVAMECLLSTNKPYILNRKKIENYYSVCKD